MALFIELTPSEKELVKMLNDNYDLNRFILCSPHSTDPVLNYGGDLSKKEKKKAFMECLYVEGNIAEENDIIEDICSGGKSTIKIVGNKGCGKTTLVYKLRQILDQKCNMRTLTLDFGESRSTLKFNHAKDALTKKVYKKLKDDLVTNSSLGLKRLINLYTKIEDSIDVDWDANNKIHEFFCDLQNVYNSNGTNKEDSLRKTVRPKLFEMELFQIILIFILCDMFENQENVRTAVFLDNLDNMVDIKDIKQMLMNYNNFLSGIGKLFESINELSGENYDYKYAFIFILRDTTNAYLTNHELAIKQIAFSEYDISKHYSKKEIGLKRINLFIKFINKTSFISNDKKENLFKTAELLSNILKDPYVTDTIFDIFNNDYRICLMTMIKIASSGLLTTSEYLTIKNGGSMHGSRGVIYRLLFDNFKKNGYFKRIRVLDFNNRGISASSPPRLILTYIANLTDTRLTHDSRVVTFDDLMDDIGEKINHTDVIRCIWEMYNLVSAEDWCNLIAFAESDDASENGLNKEWKYYKAIQNNEIVEDKVNHSSFRITTSGLAFLTYACVHFEYFACRLFGKKYPPLFLEKSLELDAEEEKYIFEIIIEKVLEEVEICAQKLASTYETDNNLCNNVDSPFVFKRSGKSAQYHVERVIFAHVQYLDEFRRFILKSKTDGLEKHVADFIIEKIEEYLKIFENHKIKCSNYGKKKVLKSLFELLEEVKLDPYNSEKAIGRDTNG